MRNSPLCLIFALLLSSAALNSKSNAQCGEQTQVSNLVNQGNTMLRARHFQEAIQQYEKALAMDSHCIVARDNIAETHNNWGIWLFQQRKFKDALAQFNKCLEVSPGHANAKRNISIINQTMSRMGLDSNGDPIAPPANATSAAGAGQTGATGSVADFDPLTGAPLTPGHSKPKPVVTSTSASAPPQGKSQVAKPAPVAEQFAAGATILTPGLKNDTAGEATGAASPFDADAPVSNYSDTTAAAAAHPLPVASTAASTSAARAETPSATIMAPPAAPSSSAGVVLLTPQPKATQPPAQLLPVTQAVRSNGGTVEEQLTALEMKMYGQSAASLNMMQRLEKMEREVSGQTRAGSIIERINFLKQNIGM